MNVDNEVPPKLDEDIAEIYNSFTFVKWRKLVKRTISKRHGWLGDSRFDDETHPKLLTSLKAHLSTVISLDFLEVQ